MLFRNAFESLLRVARAAFASLLLVGVPLADAAACAGEELSTHSAAVAFADEVVSVSIFDDANDRDGRPSGDAQHCIHGHCHHMAPFRMPEGGVKPAMMSAIAAAIPDDQSTLPRAMAGHERPPKI